MDEVHAELIYHTDLYCGGMSDNLETCLTMDENPMSFVKVDKTPDCLKKLYAKKGLDLFRDYFKYSPKDDFNKLISDYRKTYLN